MLKCLYTLLRKYMDKKIVVYGVNRTSVNLFTDLALNYQLSIYAFWDIDDKFTGEYFINRHIINTDQLNHLDNAIVIIPEDIEKQEIKKYIKQGIEVFYKNEILDISEDLKDRRIYIYGIGRKGEHLYEALREKGIDPEGVCVTKPEKIEKWCGKKVFSVGQIKWESDCSVILATDNWVFIDEMLDQLADFDIEKYIPFFRRDYVGGNFFQVINIALLNHKRIWLYNKQDEHAQYLKEVLRKYEINIYKEVYGENIYELGYENISNISVIVAEKDTYKSEQVCDILDSLGFRLEKLNYTALVCCTYSASTFYKKIKRDTLLEYNTFISERYPGYIVFGDEKNTVVKIMVLGGSTSTSNVYRTVSWVEFFYEKLSKNGYKSIIYNGAACGHGITDEFLHLMRDIEPLHPDYVISFSGVNNTSDLKAANPFNTEYGKRRLNLDDMISGIKSDETLYDFWCRISRIMKLVAGYYGAKVYSFLQPMISADETSDLVKTGMFNSNEHTKNMGVYKHRALMEEDDFYINLASMLEKKKDMYIDECHYSTEANKLIAERIFDIMKQDIEETVKHKMQQGGKIC